MYVYNSVVEYLPNGEFRCFVTNDSITKLALKHVKSSSFFIVYLCEDFGHASRKSYLGSFGNSSVFERHILAIHEKGL